MIRTIVRLFSACLALVYAIPVYATTTVTLSKAFIEENKDRATITGTLFIDYAHERPKPITQDGDIHIAGWSPETGLMTVAEIMNSRKELPAVSRAYAARGRVRAVPITGVWRMWPEHGGDHEFTQDVQGDPAPPQPKEKTNPNHIFEVHPLIKFDGLNVAPAIGNTPGYVYKLADESFHRFENTRFHLKCNEDTVQMTMSMVGYNYTKYGIVLNEDVTHTMADGAKAFKARIIDSEGDTLVSEERMIIVPGTGAFTLVSHAKEGQRFNVIGMPRVSLSLVSYRCRVAEEKPYVLDWDIPYEMVILAATH